MPDYPVETSAMRGQHLESVADPSRTRRWQRLWPMTRTMVSAQAGVGFGGEYRLELAAGRHLCRIGNCCMALQANGRRRDDARLVGVAGLSDDFVRRVRGA